MLTRREQKAYENEIQRRKGDELRPEYDLNALLENGVRGKYVERYREGTNLVLLAPDVAKTFRTEEAVNEALRLMIQMKRLPNIGKWKANKP